MLEALCNSVPLQNNARLPHVIAEISNLCLLTLKLTFAEVAQALQATSRLALKFNSLVSALPCYALPHCLPCPALPCLALP